VIRFSLTLRFIIVVLAIGMGMSGSALAAKKKTVAPVAPSKKAVKAPSGAPNVVFIIADDLNDWIGWMGGHPQARTPNMDRLAKMGMRFTNAHCSYALCNPSRTSLLTGLMPSTTGVYGNEQDWRRSVQFEGKPTLPQYFRESGFLTAAGGKVFHANHGGPEGRLAGWHGGRRGFEQDAAWDVRFPKAGVQIPDLPVHTGRNFNGLNIWHWDWGGIPVTEVETDDGQVVAWASSFLAEKQTKPFFLAVGLYRPHSPWYVPEKYINARPLEEVILPEVKADDLDDVPAVAKTHLGKSDSMHEMIMKSGQWKSAVRAYLANIDFCDAMVGRLLDALQAGPNAANTVIVFTSDHGWYLGEKQMWHKGKLWEETTRVPLVIVAPGVTQPDTTSAQPVSLLDLYPTICDLGHLKHADYLDGETLMPLLTDPSLVRSRPVITCMGGGSDAGYAARDQRWRYIRYSNGEEELYDHNADPNEWTNLASAPEHSELKKKMTEWMPKEFKMASRTVAQIAPGTPPDGSTNYSLIGGDRLEGAAAPQIKGRGVFIEASVDYDPEVDQDSSLLHQGDSQTGYALHMQDGEPTLTVFDSGKKASVALGVAEKGRLDLRAVIGTDGSLSMAMVGGGEISGDAPFAQTFQTEAKGRLAAAESFGPLSVQSYPNSTPFDGAIHRLRLTVFPKQEESPSVIPAALPVEESPTGKTNP
jgi:arylsulfatase A-like enzyme